MPISFMSPVTWLFTAMCYTGALGTECSSQPECLSIINSYSCYQTNFGDIHTPEYQAAVRSGHNIKPRINQRNVVKIKPKKLVVFHN